jgi:hypothetical protein
VAEPMDIADAWITCERQREERDREIGRAWLSLLIEGDPDKVGAVIADLAERGRLSHLDAVTKLQVSAMMFMKQVTATALNRISGRGGDTRSAAAEKAVASGETPQSARSAERAAWCRGYRCCGTPRSI